MNIEFTQEELKRLVFWHDVVEIEGQIRTIDSQILKKITEGITDKSFFE